MGRQDRLLEVHALAAQPARTASRTRRAMPT